MKALIIILVILTVIALFPLGVDAGYRNKTLFLAVKAGFFNIKLYPKKDKPPKAKKPKKSKKKAYQADDEEVPEKKKCIDKELIKPALKALGRFRKKLTIDYFRLYVVIATDDPADTAIAFGGANAITGAIMPLVDSAFDIRERDVGYSMDFLADKPTIDVWFTATAQIWELIYIAAAFGIDYLKIRNKKRNALKKERNEDNG